MSIFPIERAEVPLALKTLSIADHYLTGMHAILDAVPIDAVCTLAQLIFSVTVTGSSVYVFGNGGSAATSDHIACDLSKNTRVPGAPCVRCLSLTSPTSMMTALANDDGYGTVFADALRIFGRRGDVALAVSTSGNSPNVLAGLVAGRELGMHTAALLGFEGGAAAGIADVPIVVGHESVPHLEDVHNVINHMLTSCLRELLSSYADITNA
jgi:D-sedoheptulose 7-phosphate isomerase